MTSELFYRFLLGAAMVAAFAALGDVLRPKSFAGLFGAAPSVAMATLALTIHDKGPAYASIEARSMMIGAVAFALYAWLASYLMLSRSCRAGPVTILSLSAWLILATVGWLLFIPAQGTM